MTDTTTQAGSGGSTASGGRALLVGVAWLWVLIPFIYGVYSLVIKVPALF